MRGVAWIPILIVALALTLAPIAVTQEPTTPSSASLGTSNLGDSYPSQGETRLSIEQRLRELNSLRELLSGRLDAFEKTNKDLSQLIEKIPEIIEKQIAGLQALNEERFASIALQFRERDTRTEQTSRDNKTAVEAAFQAAKDAVNIALSSAKEAVAAQQASAALAIAKSEAATSKQIDQLANLFDTSMKGTNGNVDDVKGRVGLLEGLGAGSKEYRMTSQTSTGNIVGIVGAIVGVLSLIGFVVVNAMRQHKP